jgi:hypothetical protein
VDKSSSRHEPGTKHGTKQVSELKGVWRLVYTDDDATQEVVLETLGQSITVRRAGDQVSVLGLPARTKRLSGLTPEQLEAVAGAELTRQTDLAGGYGFSLESVRSLNDFQALRISRRGVMLALRTAGATYVQIGAFLNRTHSTVMQTLKGSERRRAAAVLSPEASS